MEFKSMIIYSVIGYFIIFLLTYEFKILKWSQWMLFNSERFHGHPSTPISFFEGWYFKQVSQDEKTAVAIIPGVFYGNSSDADHHAFILVNIHSEYGAHDFYFKYPVEALQSHSDNFNVTLGNSSFTMEGIRLDISPQEDNLFGGAAITGEIVFANIAPWPTSILTPSVMGPLQYFPFLDCYHGMLSLNHYLHGKLSIQLQQPDAENIHLELTHGKGYLEKDYGITFPKCWIWLQSNHFSNIEDISLFLAISDVPVVSKIGLNFPLGFIAQFLYKEKIYSFASYHFSAIKKLEVDEKKLNLTLVNMLHTLEIFVDRENADETAILFAPNGDRMRQFVPEALNAVVQMKLRNRWNGELIYEGSGRHSGLEVVGTVLENYEEYKRGWI